MTVYFVRHADKQHGSFFNPRLAHEDQPISRYGRRQSRRLRDYLQTKQISRIYVSEYIRTHQTIASFSRKSRIAPVVDARLNEIDLGLIEGMSEETIQSEYPDMWKIYTERASDFRFPGGETGTEASRRISSFLEDQRHQSGNVVAVAHDGIIRVLLCRLLRVPVYRRFEFRCGTTNVLEVGRDEERDVWTVVRFNQELR
jgi:probable phosphoglycerate mutase